MNQTAGTRTANPNPANRVVREPAVQPRTSTTNLVHEPRHHIPGPIPEPPPWGHRFIPTQVRELLANLGWWANPEPQVPSVHLVQTLAVLRRYGWCQSLDTTPTGRLCIRGAQNVLTKTGHTTPEGRERAVGYMQQALAEAGVHMEFFTWNDLPDQQFSAVEQLLTRAAHLARQNGE